MTTQDILVKIEKMLNEEFDATVSFIDGENVIGVTDMEDNIWFISVEESE